MRKFSAKGIARANGLMEFLIRLMMYALPAAMFLEEGFVMSAVTALFLGLMDGACRLHSYTSRSFVADRAGLEITSGFTVEVVPWSEISAIQAWHHFNRVDFAAVHVARAGCVTVASCESRHAKADLGAFIQACAGYVSAGSPRQSITVAGLCDRSVYRPLLKRFSQDVAAITLVGAALDFAGSAFSLGLLAASFSALIAAARHSFRTLRLTQRNGLWCTDGTAAQPLHTIPRALRLWVQCLVASTSAGQIVELGSNLPSDGAARLR